RNEVMPTNYILKMIRPALLAGRVLDENGNPVKGARVAVNPGSSALPGNPPENHSFYAFSFYTDSEGRWSANRIAPEVLPYMFLTASHPKYSGTKAIRPLLDTTSDNPQPETNVLLVLQSAFRISGVVKDKEGKGIQGAKIEYGFRGMSDSRRTVSENDGRFSLDGCPVGKITLAATAQDYLPGSIDFTNSADSKDVVIKLEKGDVATAALSVRVVDRHGNPIAKARVASIFRSGFPEIPVPKYNFSGETDENGLIVRTNVPASDIALGAKAKGFMSVDTFITRPDGNEHVITMLPALTIEGKVTDANTGLPIPRFRITTGEPTRFRRSTSIYHSKDGTLISTNWVIPFEGGVTNISWSKLDRFNMSFDQGRFFHTYEEPVILSSPGFDPIHNGYILKFESEGYSPFYSRILNADEERVTVDAALKPARKVNLTIFTPEGLPAALADVGFVWPGSRLRLKPGGFVRNGPSREDTLGVTDELGRFSWLPDPAVQRIVIVHWKGILQINPSDLDSDMTLYLEPWSRLEGTIARTPGRTQYNLVPELANTVWSGLSFDLASFATMPDSAGHFVMPQVPPGSLDLFWCIGNSDPSSSPKEFDDLKAARGWERSVHTLTNVVVKAGTTNVIHLIAPEPLPSNRINPIK
ncbi:MAG: resA 1, partial [Verrucomicrobiales bacterium]|nr:resA 1 [Verrucomicrobiales bacterium]